MGMHRRFKPFIQAMRDLGFEDVHAENSNRGKHPRIYGRLGDREFSSPIPWSSSDNYRAAKNFAAQVRNWIRQSDQPKA